MGKPAKDETKIKLPPEIKEQALANLELARQVGRLPYAPNFGLQVAAFSPQQEAAFASTQDAAQAFGLPSAGGTGLPAPHNVGGFRGYSTEGLYNDMMSRVPPEVLAMYNAFFGNTPGSGKPKPGLPTKGGGGGTPQVSGFRPDSTGSAGK